MKKKHFLVHNDSTIFVIEDTSHFKLQWWQLAKYAVKKFHLELFSKMQFYIFLTSIKLREN